MASTVLITGCSSGFGQATAQTLARRGYTVFASMRDIAGKNAEAAGALQALASQENLALSIVEMDITDDASVQRAVDSVLAAAGRIDVVVNNAGRGIAGLVEAMNLEELQALFAVNVLGALRVNRAVLPTMRQQRSGLLIYLSSSGGRLVYPFMGVYGATKAALEAIAETLHYEVYSLGIDTVIIQAGMYATDFAQKAATPSDPAIEAAYGLSGQIAQGFMASWAATMATGGDPRQVAEAIADLIALPAGQRPFRTAIGPFTEGLAAVNQSIEAVQSQVLPGMGLSSLLARPTT
jgi:NAD(P)-dependent dehydrogenase (short-subunit alcohol dehydrogenase family)